MNNTWELMIDARNRGIDIDKIIFQKAEVCSPYMEVALKYLNRVEVSEGDRVDINPYYRLQSVFQKLFEADQDGTENFRNYLLNAIVHELFETEQYMGMDRQAFYRQFVKESIMSGSWGDEMTQLYKIFTKEEQNILAMAVLQQYKNGSNVILWKEVIGKIYLNCYSYQYRHTEMLLYLGEKENMIAHQKIDFIRKMFLPIGYHVEIYWEHHFPIWGVEETLILDEMELY